MTDHDARVAKAVEAFKAFVGPMMRRKDDDATVVIWDNDNEIADFLSTLIREAEQRGEMRGGFVECPECRKVVAGGGIPNTKGSCPTCHGDVMTHDERIKKAVEDIAAEIGLVFPGWKTGVGLRIDCLIREAEERGVARGIEQATPDMAARGKMLAEAEERGYKKGYGDAIEAATTKAPT
jgi:hypothetical protein